MLPILINALRETLYMVLYATVFSMLLGIPLGIGIAQLSKASAGFSRVMYTLLYSGVQTVKSIPYIIIMLMFIPSTNWLINHKISFTTATILPLTITGSFLLAFEVYTILKDLGIKWQSNIKAMGASNKQAILYILLPESLTYIIEACANTAASIVGFSIIAGAFGAGGLGQLAIEKTITEPNFMYALLSILALIAIQQLLKYTALLLVPIKS